MSTYINFSECFGQACISVSAYCSQLCFAGVCGSRSMRYHIHFIRAFPHQGVAEIITAEDAVALEAYFALSATMQTIKLSF